MRMFPRITDFINIKFFKLPRLSYLFENEAPMTPEEEIVILLKYIENTKKTIEENDFDKAEEIMRKAIKISSCPKCKKELAILGIEISRLSALKTLGDKNINEKIEELLKKINNLEEKLQIKEKK